jgi:hypothetical protein
MEQQTRVSILEKEIERLIIWIRAVDTRVMVVIPLVTTMLGVLAALAPSLNGWTISSAIAFAFALLFLGLSALFSAFSTFPRTNGPKGSLIYFGGIASNELEKYKLEMRSLTLDAYIDDLLIQCHRNAQIAAEKHVWLQRAMASMFASSIPWAISVYLLYSLQP